jgi:hypothetical protein
MYPDLGYYAWIETLTSPRRVDSAYPAQISQAWFVCISHHCIYEEKQDDGHNHQAHRADQ